MPIVRGRLDMPFNCPARSGLRKMPISKDTPFGFCVLRYGDDSKTFVDVWGSFTPPKSSPDYENDRIQTEILTVQDGTPAAEAALAIMGNPELEGRVGQLLLGKIATCPRIMRKDGLVDDPVNALEDVPGVDVVNGGLYVCGAMGATALEEVILDVYREFTAPGPMQGS